MREVAIARAAILALLWIAGATPGWADARGESLIRAFVDSVDSLPGWTASASLVRSEGDGTIAEGVMLSQQDPPVSISAEELRLSSLAERPDGGFSASRVELRGGALISASAEYAIPAATLVDVSLPSLAGLSVDSRHLMSSLARFYSVAATGELGELVIPELRAARKAGEGTGESEISYRNITLSGLNDGVLGLQRVGPISVSSRGDGGEFQLTIDEIAVEQMDIGVFAHIFDEEQYRDKRGDGLWRPLASRLRIGSLSAQGAKDVSLVVDELALENIDGRQPEKPFSREWDALLDPAIPNEDRDARAIEAIASLYSAWRLGTIRMNGLDIDAPGESASLSIDAIAVSGFSQQGVDSATLKTLRGESPGGFLSLGAVELGGFAFADLDALLTFAAVEKDASADTHAEAMNAAFAALPRIDHFGAHEVVAGKSEAEPVSIGAFTLDFRNWNEVFAEETDIRIERLSIPPRLLELDTETQQMVDALGFDDLVLGLGFSDRWYPGRGTDQAMWALHIEGAADIELSYVLDGVTLDWMLRATAAAAKTADSGAALVSMLSGLKLAQAELRMEDQSLLDRAFTVAALKQGLTIGGPAYRKQMTAALPFLIATVTPSEFAQKVSAPLKDFLSGGRALIAAAAPAGPLPLMDILAAAADPLGLADLVNLTLSTEPAR